MSDRAEAAAGAPPVDDASPDAQPESYEQYRAQWGRALVAGMAHAARAQGMTEAMQLIQIAELARIRREEAAEEARGPFPVRRAFWSDAEAVERAIADEVAAALHVSPATAGRRLRMADSLVLGAPATLEALAQGRIHAAAAHRIAEGIGLLSGDTAARVERQVLERAQTQTPAQVATSVRRAVIAADPAAADRAYQRAKAARSARRSPEDDAMASIWASGTADRVARAWQTVTAVAEHRRRLAKRAAEVRAANVVLDGAAPEVTACDEPGSDSSLDVPTLDQARADAILDLLSSPDGLPDDLHDAETPAPSHLADPEETQQTENQQTETCSTPADGRRMPPFDVTVNLVVPIDSLTGRPGAAPAELSGHGPVPPAFVTDLIGAPASAASSGTAGTASTASTVDRVRFMRWLSDPAGRVTATSSSAFATYRPSPTLAATIRARDLTCRFPGCRTPAQHCDLDHTIPHPAGGTSARNLACLCRRHHRLETHGRWTLEQRPGAVLEWTSPTGYTYVTHPPEWATAPVQRAHPGRADRGSIWSATARDRPARSTAPPEPTGWPSRRPPIDQPDGSHDPPPF